MGAGSGVDRRIGQPAPELQIGPEDRRPARMMLGVKGELAAPVGRFAWLAAWTPPIGRAGARPGSPGQRAPRRPRARIAAQKSTSSAYMKYRSSSRPTASASARRTSRQAPLTQSTSRATTRHPVHIRRHERHAAVVALARAASAGAPRAGRSSRPNESSGAAVAVDEARPGDGRVGPGIERSDERVERARTERSCQGSAAAPARRTSAGCRGCCRRRTRGCARRRARGRPASARARPRRCPSDEALSTTTISRSTDAACAASDARQASISVAELNVTMTIESRGIASMKSALRARARRSARHEYRASVSRPAVRIRVRSASSVRTRVERRFDQRGLRTLDVERRRAVDLARHRGVEHDDRDAGAERLERREAEAFVFGQKHERARAAVERRELRFRQIGAQGDPVASAARRDERINVDAGDRAVVADDLQARIRDRAGQTRESRRSARGRDGG